MKTNLFLLCLIFTGNLLSAQNRMIERPAFDVHNTSTLEFDKIELSDTATILYIDAFYRPKNWIRISKDTYIRESGKTEKYQLKGSEGITPDTEFWMPESGQASFKLIFPPLPKTATKIDFIESDCDDCFKIWGIYLEAGKKPKPVQLPDEAIASLNKKDDSPLPPAAIKSGTAILSGRILVDNLPEDPSWKSFLLQLKDPITKEAKEYEVKIQKDGSFRTEIPVIAPTIALSNRSYLTATILIPGEESKVFVDLQKQCRQESRYQRDASDQSPITYAINKLNLSQSDLSYINSIPFNVHKRMEALRNVYEMNAGDYKDYFLTRMDKLIQTINEEKNISFKAKQIAVFELKIYTILSLTSYVQDSKIAYLIANKLNFNEMNNISYKPEEPDNSYYSFIKDFSLNDPDWIYSSTYPYIIDLIRHLKVFDIPQVTASMTEWKKGATEKLKKDIGNDSGLFYDLLVAQEYASAFAEMKLLTDTQKNEMNRIFTNKTYTNALLSENDKLEKISVELNKNGKFTINETPDVAQEKVLDAILAKYRGKVVFVDFWATWCGPCIRAMKEAEPVKAYFEDKEVVFLYLTGTTSPTKKWQEMVPTIHGEHYRVSNDQWGYWYSNFKIEGIPTYLIYDKEGVLKHRSTGFMGADKMKSWISEGL